MLKLHVHMVQGALELKTELNQSERNKMDSFLALVPVPHWHTGPMENFACSRRWYRCQGSGGSGVVCIHFYQTICSQQKEAPFSSITALQTGRGGLCKLGSNCMCFLKLMPSIKTL